jgi:hypothetical protein
MDGGGAPALTQGGGPPLGDVAPALAGAARAPADTGPAPGIVGVTAGVPLHDIALQ